MNKNDILINSAVSYVALLILGFGLPLLAGVVGIDSDGLIPKWLFVLNLVAPVLLALAAAFVASALEKKPGIRTFTQSLLTVTASYVSYELVRGFINSLHENNGVSVSIVAAWAIVALVTIVTTLAVRLYCNVFKTSFGAKIFLGFAILFVLHVAVS